MGHGFLNALPAPFNGAHNPLAIAMAVNHRDPAAVEDAWRRIFAFLTTMCAQAELEQLYSARSAAHYDRLKSDLRGLLGVVDTPPDLLQRALMLQQALAHHHGMWHRTPISD